MPLLFILFLTAACLPVDWPAPAFGLDIESVAAITAGYVVLALLASSLLSVRTARAAGSESALRIYGVWRRRLFFLNIGCTAACIWFGWGWAVQHAFAVPHGSHLVLAPFAELLIPGPYLLVLMANWFVYWPAERALHRAAPEVSERFWSLPAYVLFNARQFALLVLLPVFMLTGQRAVAQFAPDTSRAWWYQAATFGLILLMFVFLPLVARPLLGLKRLPAGRHRDHLTATARRLRFRAALLLWPTRNAVANAMILGMAPPVRFVVFTDRLLDLLPEDELTAVFGHEIGHAKHGHLPYYAGFFVLSITAVSVVVTAACVALYGPEWSPNNDIGPLALLGILAGYLFVVFGFLSRVCERQADIDGSRAVSCGDPNCSWHSTDTVLSAGRGPVCGTGARTMARALERVMAMGGDGQERPKWWKRVGAWLRAWQHGPATSRVNFLYRVAENPALADRHDRFAFRVRVGLAALLAAAIVASGFAIGWSEFWKML